MRKIYRRLDWILLGSILPLIFFGLVTMKSVGESGSDYFFEKQLIWIGLGVVTMFIFASIDWHVYESNTALLLFTYFIGIALLVFLIITGVITRGVQSWIKFSFFSIEPSEFMKLAIILVLAKYFARRHIEIGLSRHLIISALYVALPMVLVALQPDIGTALVFAAIWGGMIFFSGINAKQLSVLMIAVVILSSLTWVFYLTPNQKSRIITFVAPATDPQGAGYHAEQAAIAIGSGEIFGKGFGYGSQSRLKFLPESETDFIFAAFVEEWGLLGALVVFMLFGVLFWRLFVIARNAEGNFPKLVVVGIIIFVLSHFVIHIGMNTSILPITGISFPFMSYGGSLIISLMIAIGIAQSIAIHSSFLARQQGGGVDLD